VQHTRHRSSCRWGGGSICTFVLVKQVNLTTCATKLVVQHARHRRVPVGVVSVFVLLYLQSKQGEHLFCGARRSTYTPYRRPTVCFALVKRVAPALWSVSHSMHTIGELPVEWWYSSNSQSEMSVTLRCVLSMRLERKTSGVPNNTLLFLLQSCHLLKCFRQLSQYLYFCTSKTSKLTT
jgi:hypothetical protein